MEQTINVSGKQYKISSDVEISTLQMTEVIKQIEKMSCNNCGGNIRTLTKTCRSTAPVGTVLKMDMKITSGTAPYTLVFSKDGTSLTNTPTCDGGSKAAAGTYSCTYTMPDATSITLSAKVTDANGLSCEESCVVTKIVGPTCDFTVA